jgi:solute carrier family 25 S-adenosylmethionine transporter 26
MFTVGKWWIFVLNELSKVSFLFVPILFQAGSAAGTSVDVTLFPLDTVKTRLQSQAGFWGSGGFRGIYRGIGPAFVGSAPNGINYYYYYTHK